MATLEHPGEAATVDQEPLSRQEMSAADFLAVLSVVERQLRRLVTGEPTLDAVLLMDQVFRLMSDLYRQAARVGLDDLSTLSYEVAQAFGSARPATHEAPQRLLLLSLTAVGQMRQILLPRGSVEQQTEEARRVAVGLLTAW